MKRIYTFAAALLFLGACTSDGYTIRGNVEGLESPYVYLITFNGTHNVADSAKVEAGAFTFTGKTELPEVAYLSRDKEQPFVRFFLENARISIDGNLYNPNEVYPTGTAANEAMNAFNELTFNTSEAYGVTELEADKKQLVDRYKQQMRETIDRNRDNICGMIILAETGSMFFTPQEVLAEIDRFPAEWQQRTDRPAQGHGATAPHDGGTALCRHLRPERRRRSGIAQIRDRKSRQQIRPRRLLGLVVRPLPQGDSLFAGRL